MEWQKTYPPLAAVAQAGFETICAWQPIETAPQDGSEVWAYNGEQARMKWVEGDGYALWVWADELLSDADPDPVPPTHWMPLPTPPGA